MESHFYPDQVQTGATIVGNIANRLNQASSQVSVASNLDGRILSRLSFDFGSVSSELSNCANSVNAIKQNIQNVISDYYQTMGSTTATANSLSIEGFDLLGFFSGLSLGSGNPLESFDSIGGAISDFFSNLFGNVTKFFSDTGATIVNGFSSLLESNPVSYIADRVSDWWANTASPLLNATGAAVGKFTESALKSFEDVFAHVYDFVSAANVPFVNNGQFQDSRISGFVNWFHQNVDVSVNSAFSDNNISPDSFLLEHDKAALGLGEFGIDQGAIKKLAETDWDEYSRLASKLVSQGFTLKDAAMIMASIDIDGVCTYATVGNEIMAQFSNSPEAFEKIFGFPMFKPNGSLNGSELLLDMYVTMNQKRNGGKLFDGSSILTYDENGLFDITNQQYLSKSDIHRDFFQNYVVESDVNNRLISNYLKEKNYGLSYNSKNFISSTDCEKVDVMKDKINTAISNNKTLSLHMWSDPDNPVELVAEGKITFSDSFDGSHATFITGANETGITISSWGNKYNVSWEELDKTVYAINESEVKIDPTIANSLK